MSTDYRLDDAIRQLDEIAADVRYLADQHPALTWLRKLAERIQDVGDEIDDVCCAILFEEDDSIAEETAAFVESRQRERDQASALENAK